MKLEVQLHWNKCTRENMIFISETGVQNATRKAYSLAQSDIRVRGIENFSSVATKIYDMLDNEIGFVTLSKDDEYTERRDKGDTESDRRSEAAAGSSGDPEQ